MQARRVFLVLPYLDQVHECSRQSAYLWPSRKLNVLHRPTQASLLPYGLNRKWAEMENGTSDDGAVSGVYDYFGIQHADVGLDYWWLDTLDNLAIEHGLDCIHAVSPIKNDEALSSTGIADAADLFAPIRKLSLREIHERLPPTFTIDDCRRCLDGVGPTSILVPNTAAFLLRVSDGAGKQLPWVNGFPGFRFIDWFDRSLGRGKTRARVVSEDWGFGQWAAAAGLRVGATRSVVVRHMGSAAYTNEDPGQRKSVMDRDEGYYRLLDDYTDGKQRQRALRDADLALRVKSEMDHGRLQHAA